MVANNESSLLAPVDSRERLASMDVLRGFALLGIFVANIEWFNRPYGIWGVQPDLQGIDYAVAWVVAVFVSGKFWTLFALLFGMGFALMLQRAQQAQRPFVALYLRRLTVLLAFAAVHVVLLWFGDILHRYALAALLLLLARNWPPRTQLRVGVGVFLAMIALMATAVVFMPQAVTPERLEAVATVRAATAQASQVYASGGFAEVTTQRTADLLLRLGPFTLLDVLVTWSVFLIGSWLVRSGRLSDPQVHAGFFRQLAVAGLGVGLGLTVGGALLFGVVPPPPETVTGGPTWAYWMHNAGSLPGALGYLALVVLALQRPRLRLDVLAPAGRMALTHYLGQSLVCSLLFYGYGLALYGRLSYATLIALALAIFALQVWVSHGWLRRYRFGPAEWLWRSLTYLRPQPMRRSGDPATPAGARGPDA